MLSHTEFADKVSAFMEEVRVMTDIDEPPKNRETADRLKNLNYTPPVSVPVDSFLNYTTSDLIQEIGRIVDVPDGDMVHLDGYDELGPLAIKLEHISVLVFYFKELAELRREVPEAWDEVDELYVHD